MSKINSINKVNGNTQLWPRHAVANHRIDMAEIEPPIFLKPYKLKRFAAKENIYREGDRAEAVYVIRSGLVKLLSYLPNGRARIVRLLGKGSWIDLGGLLNKPHEHTAVAVGDIEIYCIPVNRLHALKVNEPQKFFQFMEKLYEHLREADMWISQFSTGAIKPRVARLVSFLSNIEYGESSTLVDLLTVHEMADILGVTPESVSRILAEFKRNDILHKLEGGPPHELYQLDTKMLFNVALDC
ncbi:MAG: Crp/Fnr family transcriptional regulator [Nitrosomonas sp.]|nr:Crp/Fnr family transcriptional regulator [Nitrosomonas sp.]